jgi:ABC-type dipeptide/oligopeptide/nickel transport system permease component
MAGAVITESVFGIPGVGRLLVEAIGARDYAVLQADLMLLVVIFIAANFAADLINAWLDPRIRYD